LTICAERSGIVGAVSNGTNEFKGLLVTTDMDYFVSPCGACRQFINEFNIKYCLLMDVNYNIQYYTIKHLLPSSPDIYHLKK
jgi:cytidine deaminase